MSTAPVPEPYDDDLMAIANATGVNPATSIRTTYTDADYAAILNTWAHQAAPPFTVDTTIHPNILDIPIGLVPTGHIDETTGRWIEHDHAPCDGQDCDHTICDCATRCPDAAAQACPHLNLLCDDCRHECVECRQDARDDGPGWAL